jgi:hypothetical protein
MWQVPKMWEGERCWILGGGVSLPKQLGVPDHIIDQVTSGELSPYVYAPWLEVLRNEHVIGVNMAYVLGDVVDVLLFGDVTFFRRFHQGIRAFQNEKVSVARLGRLFPEAQLGIKILKKDLRQGINIRQDEVIRWNSHSGGAAINLAALFGVKEIYLLGFDMQADEKGRTHWHHQYTTATKPSLFKSFQRSFQFIARDAKKLGIKIVNVNPDSAITQFPKVSLNGELNRKPSVNPKQITFQPVTKVWDNKGGVKDKYSVLQLMHVIYNPQLYLEIGIRKGSSFKLSKCKSIGVDPNPLVKNSNEEIHKMTSDEFFEKRLLGDRVPDLVFLDGLHTFEQTLLDFINVEKHSGKNTIVVFDDVLPRNTSEAEKKKPAEGVPWTGDVWKIIFVLKELRPELHLTLLNISTGLLIVTGLDSGNTTLHNKYDEVITEWSSKKVPSSIIERKGIDARTDFEWALRNARKVTGKKILCCVIHYYNPNRKGGFQGGSTIENPEREKGVLKVIDSVRQIEGCDVFVCGCGKNTYPSIKLDKDFDGINPHWLLYETLNWMGSRIEEYDYFVCLEDDTLMGQDVLHNVIEFDKQAGLDEILHPSRIERSENGINFIDLQIRKRWTQKRKKCEGEQLAESENYNSSISIFSKEKFRKAINMLNPDFREIWFGGPMASAHAYFNSPFTLYRDFSKSLYHVVEHTDLFRRRNKQSFSHFHQPERLKVDRIETKIPYELNGDLAEAYNLAMQGATSDWVLLLDHDVFLACNPYWYEICLEAVRKVDEKTGLLTCVTSPRTKVNSGLQNAKVNVKGEDIKEHIQGAKQSWEDYGVELEEIKEYRLAGFFMLVNKRIWEKILFKDQGKGVNKIDWDYCDRLLEAGYKIYKMRGLYVYHHRGIRTLNWERRALNEI